MSSKKRKSNIELLRLFAIFGVIILHYCNPFIGGGIAFAKEGGLNFYCLYFLVSLFACAVNLFVLISGYFMCESTRRNIWRPIELIVQVIVFNGLIYLLNVLLKVHTFSVKACLNALIPANYFVILYCAVYLVSPWISILFEKATVKSLKKLLVISFILFSVYPTVVDAFFEITGKQIYGISSIGLYGSQWGYSFTNFLFMYILGVCIKKGALKIQEWKIGFIVLSLIANVWVIVIWARVNDKIGYFTERSAWEYCNPLVIITAVLLFALFNKIDIGEKKIINIPAEAVFSVFLLHHVFIPYLKIEQFVSGNIFVMIAHIIVSTIIVFTICMCVHFIYSLITKPIFKLLSNKFGLIIEADK